MLSSNQIQAGLMLTVPIAPSFEGISIRPADLPRDSENLLAIQRENAHDSLWAFQPQQVANDSTWRILLKMPSYNAYILSYYETPLFLLELMAMSDTEYSAFYDEEPGDFWLRVSLVDIHLPQTLAARALSASVQGMFTGTSIRRLIAPIHFSRPGSMLLQILDMAGFAVLKEKTGTKSPVIYSCSAKKN